MDIEIERRRHRRIPIDELIYIKNLPDSPAALGTDISEGGIFVRMAKPLPVGSTVELEAHFKLQPSPVILKGKVVWTVKGEEPGMGLKFCGLSEEAEKTLVNYIAHRQLKSSSHPPPAED